jgi:hypothetical protein
MFRSRYKAEAIEAGEVRCKVVEGRAEKKRQRSQGETQS